MKIHFTKIAMLLMVILASALGGRAASAAVSDACADKTTEVGVFKCFGSQFLAFDPDFLAGTFTASPYTVGKNQFWRIETVLASGVKLTFTGSNNSIKAIMLNPNKSISSSLFTLESVTVGGNTQAISINSLRAGVSAAVLAVAPDAVVDPKAPYKVNADGSLVFEHSVSGHAVGVSYSHGQSTPQATVDGLTISQHEARILAQLTALHAASGGASGTLIEVGQVRLTGGQITFNATISGQVLTGSVSGSSGGSVPAVQLSALDPAVIGPRVANYLTALFGRPITTVAQGRGADGIMRYAFTAGAGLVVEVDPFGTPRLKFANEQAADPLLFVPANTSLENALSNAAAISGGTQNVAVMSAERIGDASCGQAPCPEPGSVHVTVSLNVPSTGSGAGLAMEAVFETYIDPELGVGTRIFSLKSEDRTDQLERLRQQIGVAAGDLSVESVRVSDGQLVFQVTVAGSGGPRTVTLPLADTARSWDRASQEIVRLFGAGPGAADEVAFSSGSTAFGFLIGGFRMQAVVPAADQQPVTIAPVSESGRPFSAQESARIFGAIAAAKLHMQQNYGRGSIPSVQGMSIEQICTDDEPVSACTPDSLTVTIVSGDANDQGDRSTATYAFADLMAGGSPARILRQVRQYQFGELVLEADYNEAGYLTHERTVQPGGNSSTDITRDARNRETLSVSGSGGEAGNQTTVVYTTYASDTDDKVIERKIISENDPNGGSGVRSSEIVIETWDAQLSAYRVLTIVHVFDGSDPNVVLETRVSYREGSGPARRVYNLGGPGRIDPDVIEASYRAQGFEPRFTVYDPVAEASARFIELGVPAARPIRIAMLGDGSIEATALDADGKPAARLVYSVSGDAMTLVSSHVMGLTAQQAGLLVNGFTEQDFMTGPAFSILTSYGADGKITSRSTQDEDGWEFVVQSYHPGGSPMRSEDRYFYQSLISSVQWDDQGRMVRSMSSGGGGAVVREWEYDGDGREVRSIIQVVGHHAITADIRETRYHDDGSIEITLIHEDRNLSNQVQSSSQRVLRIEHVLDGNSGDVLETIVSLSEAGVPFRRVSNLGGAGRVEMPEILAAIDRSGFRYVYAPDPREIEQKQRKSALRAFEQAFSWRRDDSMTFTDTVKAPDGSITFKKTMGSVFQVTVGPDGSASAVEMLDESGNVVDGSDFAQRALGFVGQAAALAGVDPSMVKIESLMQYGNIQCEPLFGADCPSMGDWNVALTLSMPSEDPAAPHHLRVTMEQRRFGGKDGPTLMALVYGGNNIYELIRQHLEQQEGAEFTGFSIQGDRLRFSFSTADGRQQTGSVRLADGSDLNIDPDHGDPDFEIAVRAINDVLPLATPVTYGDLTGDGGQPGAHVMTWGAVQVHVAEGWSSAQVFIGGLQVSDFMAKLQGQADQDFAAATNFWGYGSSIVIDGIQVMGDGQSLVRVRLSGAGGEAYWSYGVNQSGDLYMNETPYGALVDSLIPQPDPYNPDPGYYDPSMGGGYDPSTGYDPNLGYDPTLYPDPVYPDPYQPWVDTMMQEAAAQQRIAEIFGDLSSLDLGYQGVQETTWDGYLTARWNHIAVQVDSNYSVVEARLLDENGNTISNDLQGVIDNLNQSVRGLTAYTDPLVFGDFRVENGQILFRFEHNGQIRHGSADTSGGNVWLMPDHGDPDFEVAVNALNSVLPLESPVTMSDLTGDPSGAPHVMTWGVVEVHVADMWTSAECFIAMPDGTLVPAQQAMSELLNAVETRVPGYGSSTRIQSIAAVNGGIRFEVETDAAGVLLKADLDATGQIVRTEVHSSSTGEFGGSLWDSEATLVYNAAGVQIVYQESQKRSDLSGGLQYSITFDYEYDDQGRSIRERTVETDYDQGAVTGSHEYGVDCAYNDNGSGSCLSTDLYRDETGKMTSRSVWDQQFWSDAGVSFEKIDMYYYDSNDRLTRLNRSTWKYDADHNFLGFEVSTVETHAYELDGQSRLIRETITVVDNLTLGKTISVIDYDPITGRPLKDVEAEMREQAKALIASTFDLTSQEEFELDLGSQDANGDWHFQWAQGGIIDVVLSQDGSAKMMVSDTDGKATGVDVLSMFGRSTSRLGSVLQSEDHGLETYWIEITPAQDVLEVDYENPLFDEEGNFAGFGEKWVHYDAVYEQVYGLPMPQAYVSNAKLQWIEVVGQGMNCTADGPDCEFGTVKAGISGSVVNPADGSVLVMTAQVEQMASDESPRIVSFKLNGVDYARKAADDLGDRMEQKLDVASVSIQGSEIKITIKWDGVTQEEKTYSIGSPEPSGGRILYDPLTGIPITTTNQPRLSPASGLGTLTPLSGQTASVPVLTVQNDLVARPAGTLSITAPAPSLQVQANTGMLDSLADRNQLFITNGTSSGPYQNVSTMNSQSQMGPFQASNDNN